MINYNLRFKTDKGQKYFFVSDLHYNHDRDFIWGAPGRKYKDVNDMNHDIINQWNAYVSHDDTVFHLGDMIFNDNSGEALLNLYDRLSFKTLYCLFGNHTSGERHVYRELMKQEGFEDREIYPTELKLGGGRKVVFLGYYSEISIDKQRINLFHYPIESWNGIAKGNWNIHGHSHCNLKNVNNIKRIDVGWDYKTRPVEYKELKKVMDVLRGKPGDHHR